MLKTLCSLFIKQNINVCLELESESFPSIIGQVNKKMRPTR